MSREARLAVAAGVVSLVGHAPALNGTGAFGPDIVVHQFDARQGSFSCLHWLPTSGGRLTSKANNYDETNSGDYLTHFPCTFATDDVNNMIARRNQIKPTSTKKPASQARKCGNRRKSAVGASCAPPEAMVSVWQRSSSAMKSEPKVNKISNYIAHSARAELGANHLVA